MLRKNSINKRIIYKHVKTCVNTVIKMQKTTIKPHFGNKKFMLLGIRNDKAKIWMEQASFDCDWYYGFGYLEVLNHRHTDVKEHYHFSSFYETDKNAYDAFKQEFLCTPLTDKELWILFDLMQSFYTLKKASEIYHIGGSNYATHELNLKSETKYKEAMEDQKKIIFSVQKLLGVPDSENKILRGV